MMRKIILKTSILGCLLLISILSTSIALAKGPPAKVVIERPGIDTPIEITDPELLLAFSLFQFEDIEHPVVEPKDTGPGFVITRYVAVSAGLIPWDRLVYYPMPNEAAGVVFLEGILGPDSSEFDGRWYEVAPNGEAAMQKILTAAGSSRAGTKPGKSVQSKSLEAQPRDKAPVSPASQTAHPIEKILPALQPVYVIVLGLAGLGLVGTGFILRKRRGAPAD